MLLLAALGESEKVLGADAGSGGRHNFPMKLRR